MTTPFDQAKINFFQGVNIAIEIANESGVVAPVRFTFLADMMQIQCLCNDNTNLLEFTLPEGLYSTVKDIATHSGAEITVDDTKEKDRFILKFPSTDDQDEFIKLFEMMSFHGKRAYPTPDLYIGQSNINKDFCRELLVTLEEVIQKLHENGWQNIR